MWTRKGQTKCPQQPGVHTSKTMTKHTLLTVYSSNNYLECINVLVQSYHMMPKKMSKQ